MKYLWSTLETTLKTSFKLFETPLEHPSDTQETSLYHSTLQMLKKMSSCTPTHTDLLRFSHLPTRAKNGFGWNAPPQLNSYMPVGQCGICNSFCPNCLVLPPKNSKKINSFIFLFGPVLLICYENCLGVLAIHLVMMDTLSWGEKEAMHMTRTVFTKD